MNGISGKDDVLSDTSTHLLGPVCRHLLLEGLTIDRPHICSRYFVFHFELNRWQEGSGSFRNISWIRVQMAHLSAMKACFIDYWRTSWDSRTVHSPEIYRQECRKFRPLSYPVQSVHK
jgi:hypothetical protein